MSRFLPSRRAIPWAALALLLAAFAYGLHEWLPPEPRWVLHGDVVVSGIASDGSTAFVHDGVPVSSFTQVSTDRVGTLTLRDLRTGDVIKSFFGSDDTFGTLAHSADRQQLAGVHWDDNGRTAVHLLDVDGRRHFVFPWHHERVGEPTFSPDGKVMTAGTSLVDTATGDCITRVAGSSGHWWYTPYGRHAITIVGGKGEPAAKVFDLHALPRSFGIAGIGYIEHISPDGRFLIGSRFDQNSDNPGDFTWLGWVVWDLVEGETRDLGGRFTDRAQWLFSADGSTLAVWEGGDPKGRVELWSLRPVARSLSLELDHAETKVCLSATGHRCVVVEDNWGPQPTQTTRIRLLDTADGRCLWERSWPEWPPIVHFLPGGNGLLVRSAGRLHHLDVETGASRSEVPIPGESADLYSDLRVSPDGRWTLIRHEFDPIESEPWGTRARRWFSGGVRSHRLTWQPMVSVVDNDRWAQVFRLERSYTSRPTGFMGRSHTAGVNAWLTDDGSSLLVLTTALPPAEGEERPAVSSMLECFDIPARKPWRWVLGPPAALGAVVLAGRWAWRRRGPRKVVRA